MKNIWIWVEEWQMKCCGDPFKVGDEVTWTAEEWRCDMPKIPGVEEIDYNYENHGDDDVHTICGTVRRIFAVYQTYKLNPADNRYYPDLGKIIEICGEAIGWEEDMGEYSFSAYYVLLE